jgi:hypothetical protein
LFPAKKVVNKVNQFLLLEGLFLTTSCLKLPENNDKARQYKTKIDILHKNMFIEVKFQHLCFKKSAMKTVKNSSGLAHAFY